MSNWHRSDLGIYRPCESDLRTENASRWAATALLIYDIAITLDQEVSLVWKSKLSLPKLLYIASRYLGLATLLMDALYSTFAHWANTRRYANSSALLGVILVAFACDGLLTLRVTALYQHRKFLCRVLYAIFFLLYSAEIVFACMFFIDSSRLHSWHRDPECFKTNGSVNGPIISSLAAVPVLTFNTLLFVLTLVDLFPHWHRRLHNDGRLLILFFRQGSAYFALMFTVLLLQTVLPLLLSHGQEGLEFLSLPWVMVAFPISSNRLFLDLRGVLAPSVADATSSLVTQNLHAPRQTSDDASDDDGAAEEDPIRLSDFQSSSQPYP